MGKRVDGWEAERLREIEKAKSEYQFWEKKRKMCFDKGNDRGVEEAEKHIAYWKDRF